MQLLWSQTAQVARQSEGTVKNLTDIAHVLVAIRLRLCFERYFPFPLLLAVSIYK